MSLTTKYHLVIDSLGHLCIVQETEHELIWIAENFDFYRHSMYSWSDKKRFLEKWPIKETLKNRLVELVL